MGTEIVTRVVRVWEEQPAVRDRMVAMLRSGISHERAAGLLRDLFGRTLLRALGELAVPDHRELRTGLVGTQIGGLLLGRYVLRIPPVADASAEQLIAAVGPVVQHYLTGDLGADGSAAPASARGRRAPTGLSTRP
jgi:hypothetical protein